MRRTKSIVAFSVAAVLLAAGCDGGLTEPDLITIHVRGHVLNREDGSPLSARVQLEHEESNGDWVLTSYRTVVDASTTTDHAGRYDLEYRTEGCPWYTLAVEADGFIPTRERIPCIDGVQTVTVPLDPGWCWPLFGCTRTLSTGGWGSSWSAKSRLGQVLGLGGVGPLGSVTAGTTSPSP